MANFYDVLHVSRDAPRSLIRASYNLLSKDYKVNPHIPSEKPAALRRIETAFEVLYDPDRRKKYDDLLLKQEKVAPITATHNEAPRQNPSQQPAEKQNTNKETRAQHQPAQRPPAQASVEDHPGPMDDLYRAFIGRNSQQYYLDVFREFERQRKEGRLSWFGKFNIAAWFGGLAWFWYRKMYVYQLALMLPILLCTKIVDKLFHGYEQLFVSALLFVPFGIIANRLYYNVCRKRISESAEIALHSDRIAYLAKKGQTTYTPIYVMAVSAIIGILASIILPAVSSNMQQRAQKQGVARQKENSEQPVDWSQFKPVDNASKQQKESAPSAEDKWWEKHQVVTEGDAKR